MTIFNDFAGVMAWVFFAIGIGSFLWYSMTEETEWLYVFYVQMVLAAFAYMIS